MKYVSNIYLFLIMVMACEQVVEIDIPDHESQLVLSSFYEAGDSSITAYLTKSIGILDDEDSDDVWGATINLYENDMFIGQFKERADTTYRFDLLGFDHNGHPVFQEEFTNIFPCYHLNLSTPLEQGKTYKITAEVSDYVGISAIQQLPAILNIGTVTYLPVSGFSLNGYLMDVLQFTLEDVGGKDDYYEFKVYSGNGSISNANFYPRYIESYTLGIEQGKFGMLLLNDDLFDGNTYDIELLIRPEDTTYSEIHIEISSISRDKYLFAKSLEAYYNVEENPFAEPVIVHTNIENGQGIFSMENKTEIIIE